MFDPGTLTKNALESLEADSFWCLSALLDGIQVYFCPSYHLIALRIIIYSRNPGFNEWCRLCEN